MESQNSQTSVVQEKFQGPRSKTYSEETVDQVYNEFLDINHDKADENCTYFKCVYDGVKVANNNARVFEHNFKNMVHANPIDFFAPYGEAYFNKETGTPLVILCDHKPCIPAQHQTLAAVKVVNMDGVLSQPPRDEDTYLPWFPNRNHHKAGEKLQQTLKSVNKYSERSEFENFVEQFLLASGKYPETFFRNGKRLTYMQYLQEFSVAAMYRKALIASKKRIVEFTKEDEAQCFIKTCKEHLNEKFDYGIGWNPLIDTISNSGERLMYPTLGLANYDLRYQPFELYSTFKTQMDWFGVLPAAFVKVPVDDLVWYDETRAMIKSGCTAKALTEKVEVYPAIGLEKEITKQHYPVQVWYQQQNQGIKRYFIRLTEHKGEVGKLIKFQHRDILHVIDSMLDLVFLYCNDLRQVYKELDFYMAENNYKNGEGFEVDRDSFGLKEAHCFEFNAHRREQLIDTEYITGFNRPSFQFNCPDKDTIRITKHGRYPSDQYSYDIPSKYAMTVIKCLIRCGSMAKPMADIDPNNCSHNLLDHVRNRVMWVCKSKLAHDIFVEPVSKEENDTHTLYIDEEKRDVEEYISNDEGEDVVEGMKLSEQIPKTEKRGTDELDFSGKRIKLE